MRKQILISICALLVLGIGVIVFAPASKAPAHKEAGRVESGLYVSLGDSVASGLGLATPADDTACGRSNEAYPHLLAAATDKRLLHLACTGATLDAGINGPQTAAGEQVSQRETLFASDPDLITFAIGANDVTWLSRLAECFRRACASEADRDAYRQMIRETFKPRLKMTLEALNKRYGDDTEILVIEYYQVFPKPGKSCGDVTGLDDKALAWARELRGGLNQAVREVVEATRVGTYVTMDFSGHELCSREPWIQGLTDPAPYHANAAGQRAIAERILKELRER